MLASHRVLAVFGLVCLWSLSCDMVQLAPQSDAAQADAGTPMDRNVAAVARALRHRHTGLRSAEIDRVAETIVHEAERAGFTPRLVMAVIHVESSGYNFAVSSVGALGLMQLLPATAEALAGPMGVEWNGPGTLFDPEVNVRLGVTYLEGLVLRFGDVDLALAAYNWGPTRIADFLREGQAIPEEYVRKVRNAYLRPTGGFGLIT